MCPADDDHDDAELQSKCIATERKSLKKKHHIFQSGKIEADAPIITLFSVSSVSPFFVSQGDRGPPPCSGHDHQLHLWQIK